MKQATTTEQISRKRRYWLADNPGILTQIASELGVTRPFVGDILYGRRKSRSGDIEARLAELGAPGFKEQANA